MANLFTDAECRNTAGFFKDPATGAELNQDTPRVPGYGLSSPNYNPETGAGWREVHVYLSDGRSVSLAHTCYTQDEKSGYTKYRRNGSSSSTQSVSRSTGLPDTGKKMLQWVLVKAPELLDEYIVDMCPVYQSKLNELIDCGVDEAMAKDLAMKMAKKALQIPAEPAQAQAE